MEKETVWLTQAQISMLFEAERSVITKHLRNIFNSKELDKNSVCAKIAHTAADGKIYKTQFYNLDAVISIGYRVNSQRATQFRIWATNVLKNYLLKGYALNQRHLREAQEKFKELQSAISFLQEKAKRKLLSGQEQEILNLLADYSKTLTLLEQYDKQKLALVKKAKGKFVLKYADAKQIIQEIKTELLSKKEAGDLFGQEAGEKFQAILGNIYQTFAGQQLYFSLEEKAAHFLYFIIKDHPLRYQITAKGKNTNTQVIGTNAAYPLSQLFWLLPSLPLLELFSGFILQEERPG